MSSRYWLNQRVLVEVDKNGALNLVLPALRCRANVGPGVVQVLSEVARLHSLDRGAVLKDIGGTPECEHLLAELLSLGVLVQSDTRPEAPVQNEHSLTLAEYATLRMAQAGGCYLEALPEDRRATPR